MNNGHLQTQCRSNCRRTPIMRTNDTRNVASRHYFSQDSKVHHYSLLLASAAAPFALPLASAAAPLASPFSSCALPFASPFSSWALLVTSELSMAFLAFSFAAAVNDRTLALPTSRSLRPGKLKGLRLTCSIEASHEGVADLTVDGLRGILGCL